MVLPHDHLSAGPLEQVHIQVAKEAEESIRKEFENQQYLDKEGRNKLSQDTELSSVTRLALVLVVSSWWLLVTSAMLLSVA